MAFLSKYGEARVIQVPMIKRGVVDFAVGADWTPAAGDVKITKDGGAAANVTNLPTALTMGNTALWVFSLTATEMQAARVEVTVADAATKAVEDTAFALETYGNASAQHAFDLDTASTAQTGDSFARLGAPAAASVSADILAIDNFVDDIESRLGTPSNLGSGATVAANLVDIEGQTDDIGVAGAGLTAIPTIAAVTTVTNLTNAPTAGDLTATMKTSVSAAVWNEDATGHQTLGTFGQAIGDPVADANTIFKAVVSDAAGATVGVDVVAVQADTDDIQARLPAVLVGGRMAANAEVVGDKTGYALGVGGIAATAFVAGAIDSAAIAADAIGAAEIANGAIDAATFAANAVDAAALATDAVNEIRDAIFARAFSAAYNSHTFDELIKMMAAVLYGKCSGMATATGTFRTLQDLGDVIVATQDADGNRTAVTRTP